MNLLYGLLLPALLALAAAPAGAAGAHQHGVLTLDIAVEAGRLVVQMESPLDNLVGFERAPRNAAERKRVDAALERLQAGQALFVIDPAAQCTLAKVELSSAVLKLGSAANEPADDDHADIDAAYEFDCANAAQAAHVDVGLFQAFSGMQRIEVQVAAPQGQFKRTLRRPTRRVALTR